MTLKRYYSFVVMFCIVIIANLAFFVLFADSKEERAVNQLSTNVATVNFENEAIITTLDQISKEEFYKTIISLKEERATDLYNILMFFITFIGLFATVAAAIISYYIVKVREHQKKIDLVYDSKSFDEKLNRVEESILKLKRFERAYKIELIQDEFRGYTRHTDGSIQMIDQYNQLIPADMLEDYFHYKTRYEESKKDFLEYKYDLNRSDYEDDDWLPEDELRSYLDDIKEYGKGISKVINTIAKNEGFRPF